MEKEKILIVDDIPENIDVLFSLLKDEYEILASRNGIRALELVESNFPDLVLLDIMMPEMDGYEVCRRIKSDSRFKNIPIIFLTAKTQIEDISKGFEYGAVDYIVKPFNPIELELRVKNHLELKRSKAELKAQNEKLSLINIELNNNSKNIEEKSEYLEERIKKILTDQNGINLQLQSAKELLSLIAINDLGSLKVVSKILDNSKDSLDAIIKDPNEEYFKILSLAIEPLKMAISDIEGAINALISVGLIDKLQLVNTDISKTSFNSLLEDIYMEGKLSPEIYEDFLNLAKYTIAIEEDNFTLF